MAVARADMAFGQTMVLCIGADQIRVSVGPDGEPLLDENGHPSAHDAPCPDCVIGSLALPQAAHTPDLNPVFLTSVDETAYRAANHAVRLQGGQGRDPPQAA